MTYQIGEWEVTPELGVLRRGGEEVNLTPQQMAVLEYLVSRCDAVVPIEDILDSVWSGSVTGDYVVYNAISHLRKIFGDGEYIQTIPKKGYRLIARVDRLDDQQAAESDDKNPADPPQKSNFRRLIIAPVSIVILLLALVMGQFLPQDADTQLYERAAFDGRHSVAVIPFSNLSPDPNNAFYAAGLHEEVLNQLSKLNNLAVISRTSMLRYQDTRKPIPVIVRELNVDSVIEGSVRYADDRIRVTIQLVDGVSDQHLWSETYDRELVDLFEIESEIARSVADALNLALTEEEANGFNQPSTRNLRAFSEYVLGRKALEPRHIDGIDDAVEHFKRATDLDPGYAIAWVGLAEALHYQVQYGTVDMRASFPERQRVIDRAIALDPLSGEAWLELTKLQLSQGVVTNPEPYYHKAVELSPNYAQAHHALGDFYTHSGRPEQALPFLKKALRLDPAVSSVRAKLSRALFYLGRSQEALQFLADGIRAYPNAPALYRDLCDFLGRMGRLAESLYWVKTAANLPSHSRYIRNFECQALAQIGYKAEARSCYHALVETYPRENFDFLQTLYMDVSAEKLEALQRELGNLQTDELRSLLAAYTRSSDWQKAYQLMETLDPHYFADEPLNLLEVQLGSAFTASMILQNMNEPERSRYLLSEVTRLAGAMDRIHAPTYALIIDVIAFASLGDKTSAIDRLQEAYDEGWRHRIWNLRNPDTFAELEGDPAWEALVAKFESHLISEQVWYEQHKDDPREDMLERLYK